MDDQAPRGGGRGRDETQEERLDRMWNDLLQELRVMQTGAQLTAGFLLTLPFQQRFASLDGPQRALYLALVLLPALTTALVLTPVDVVVDHTVAVVTAACTFAVMVLLLVALPTHLVRRHA